jgi:CRISPR-associated protein Cmr1
MPRFYSFLSSLNQTPAIFAKGVLIVKLTLRTLTPLWTGGIDAGQSDRVHETGIIGSLRWWYEAILRGCGVRVCDPTTHNCTGCPACQAYGMTGQRRQWRFTFQSSGQHPFNGEAVRIPSGRKGGWYVGNGFVGDLALQALSLRNGASSYVWELPLHLAALWGGIGPKTQIGYGVIDVCDEAGNFIEPDADSLLPGLPNGNYQDDSLPDLRNFFFAILEFKASGDWWKKASLIDLAIAPSGRSGGRSQQTNDAAAKLEALARLGCVPVAPAFRNWLRYGNTITTQDSRQLSVSMLGGFTRKREKDATTELFGEVQGNNRRRSRLNISFAYPASKQDFWEIRVWGWVPPSRNYDRDAVLNSLYGLLDDASNWEHLLGYGASDAALAAWRDFNPTKRTMHEYLRNLLIGETSQ